MNQHDDRDPHERDLLTAWRRGDQQAGETLFRAHADAVTRFFGSKVSDASQVADLVHRTFMTLQRSSAAIVHSVRAFVFGVARNELRHYVHRRVVEAARGDRLLAARDAGDLTAHDADPRDPEAELGERMDRRLVGKTLRRLGLDDQVLLELTYWEDVPRAELAAIFAVPEPTMASRIRLARGRFAAKLRELSTTLDLFESTSKTASTWLLELHAHRDVMRRRGAARPTRPDPRPAA